MHGGLPRRAIYSRGIDTAVASIVSSALDFNYSPRLAQFREAHSAICNEPLARRTIGPRERVATR